MLWLKFLHITALSVWVAGLIYLPALLSAHRRLDDQQDFARVRMSSRFVYLFIASPAACLAVASGTALLFVSDVRHPWMLAKLVGVGVLAICHYRYGSLLSHLAEAAPEVPALRARLIAIFAAVAASYVLWAVLAKPDLGFGTLPEWMTAPAGIINLSLRPDHSV